MLRLLVLLLLALLIWMLLDRLLALVASPAPRRRARPGDDGRTGGGRGETRPAERLVRCGTCGVRVPESRVLPATAGAAYCSEACRRQAVRDTA